MNADAMHKYFLKMQSDNSEFFYLMDLDEKGRLRNVFWADARCRAAFKEFGDVVTFDTTYLTNKYDMPFAPFVGVNHHGLSILLGCALISKEDTDTFIWLFRAWLVCMGGSPPNAIITDQDRAMKNTIEVVFPNVCHRLCLWHIMKKVPEKLKSYNDYENIKFDLQNVVYDALTVEEFEDKWSCFIWKYQLDENDWLAGLFEERCHWVPAFVKDTFWAGMSTTQRSESMNAFFDGFEMYNDGVFHSEIVEDDIACEREGADLNGGDGEIQIPSVGMKFNTIEEAFIFYKHYARHIGFGVCKRSSNKGPDGDVKVVIYSCARQGFSSSKSIKPMKPRPVGI
ncbi:hypothetical protein OROMI_007653 [Orobanche minor]